MRVELPILVQQYRMEKTHTPFFLARPLFIDRLERTGERLDRLLNRLVADLREYLNILARDVDHRPFARAVANPALQSIMVRGQLTLRRRTVRGQWHAIVFRVRDTQVGFVTEYPEHWFVIRPDQSVSDRVIEVLTDIALRLEKDEQRLPLGLKCKSWTTQISVNVTASQVVEKKRPDFASFFAAPGIGSGAEELQKVSRSLDALYPDGLDRACLRDDEVTDLSQLLDRADRPSVLLTGPTGAGKTTLVHEYVRCRRSKPSGESLGKHQVFTISPQRLISGMSYLGQWEERVLAILKHVKKMDHILLIDDVVGLFHAGRSSQSDLTVGQVLKPFIERRDVRIIGELTPDEMRILRELDRGFADLFHVMHVREPDASTYRRMLVATMRRIEDQQRCQFGLEVLPTAVDLTRRYVQGVCFPGKAAALLSQIASKQKGEAIDRADVISAFHERSGLPRSYVDDQQKLTRSRVVEKIAERVIGQDHAIEAVADVVCIGKARLSAPDRPLGSLLFLGPTGVGKTQLAKSLAAFIYGRAERLLRFDMNSFNDAGAPLRLVGSFREPDGQLTAAIRRQPFSVVLLDEIEKAHPDVHDLLLQVLGEGRLTDALGRTADFTNAIIVLTSNLGVREASQRLGFGATKEGDTTSDQTIYTAAARAFFRPELFNRFDRIVPFNQLSREETAKVADILMRDILQREGLGRRRSILRVAAAATERIIDSGFDEHFGARAMRRALERELTRPIAVRLARLPSDASVLIDVYPGAKMLDVVTTPLAPAARTSWPPRHILDWSPADVAERARMTLARIESSIGASRGEATFVSGNLDPDQLAYLALREEISDARRKADAFTKRIRPPAMKSRSVIPPRSQRAQRSLGRARGATHGRPPKARVLWTEAPTDLWAELLDSDEPSFYLKQLVQEPAESDKQGGIAGELTDLLAQLNWLEAVAQSRINAPDDSPDETCALVLRCLSPAERGAVSVVGKQLSEAFGLPWGIEVEWRPPRGDQPTGEVGVLLISGPGSATLARAESGTHVYVNRAGHLVPVQAIAIPANSIDDATARMEREEQSWTDDLCSGRASVDDRPWKIGPIHRIIDAKGPIIDLRSGLMTASDIEPYDLMAFAVSQMPLPREFDGQHAGEQR